MTGTTERAAAGLWSAWRIARWAAVLVLLLLPLVMMQVSDEWNWGILDFLFAGTMIGGTTLLYELAERTSGSRALSRRGGTRARHLPANRVDHDRSRQW